MENINMKMYFSVFVLTEHALHSSLPHCLNLLCSCFLKIGMDVHAHYSV